MLNYIDFKMKIVISEDTNKYYGDQIVAVDPDIQIFSLNPENPDEPAWAEVPESDALFLSYQFLFAVRDHDHLFQPMLELCKKMKFIQSGYAGMDAPFLQAVIKECNATIANASSIYGKPMSHYVLAQMLRWNKRIDEHATIQKNKEWIPNGGDGELTDKTMVILGYGGIGKEVAKLGKAFGMRVTGLRRNPEKCEFADEVLSIDKLDELLPLTDFLIMALPDSQSTRDVVNKEFLHKMNPSSMLINVGRGSAIVEDDLAEALNNRVIAAAALDTTKKEPLEKSSKLWEAKNCFITPHDSAHSLMSLPRSFNLFLENIKNLKNNKPITNLWES